MFKSKSGGSEFYFDISCPSNMLSFFSVRRFYIAAVAVFLVFIRRRSGRFIFAGDHFVMFYTFFHEAIVGKVGC